MQGFIISFEGVDGSGKSSQVKLLESYLNKKNINSIILREPGATKIGEKIRKLILDKNNKEMTAKTEAYLYAAARAQLVEEKIKPAINDSKVVICDRFIDSSLAYQGYARGLGIEEIEKLNSLALGNLEAKFTFYLDLNANEGLKRKENSKVLDRLEEEKLDFHDKVYEAYNFLCEKYPKRIMKIDASLDIYEIHEKIINILEKDIKILEKYVNYLD